MQKEKSLEKVVSMEALNDLLTFYGGSSEIERTLVDLLAHYSIALQETGECGCPCVGNEISFIHSLIQLFRVEEQPCSTAPAKNESPC